MAFDGVTLHTIVSELQFLKNAKVNSIYEPSQNNIVISVYNKKTYAINIDTTANNYRMHLTIHDKQNPRQLLLLLEINLSPQYMLELC